MRRVVCLALALLVSGCGAQEFFFNKDVDLKPGHGQMSDIKQRGVFVQERPDADGNKSPVVCAEPSPDAMSAVAASLAAKLGIEGEGSGAVAASMTESAAFTGLRTQTIQLLRDGFYRICEGYMSGALNQEDFSIMQRRYQANMLALLTIEQLTGAVKAPAITLGGSADATLEANAALIKERNAAQLQRDKDAAALAVAKGAQPPKTAEEIATLQKAVDDDEKKLKELEKLVAAGGDIAVNVSSQKGNISGGYAGADSQTIAAVSKAVVEVAQSVIDADYTGQMCFEHLRRAKAPAGAKAPDGEEPVRPTPAAHVKGADNGDREIHGVSDFCNVWFRQFLTRMRASTKLTTACVDLVDTLRSKNELDKASATLKSCLAEQNDPVLSVKGADGSRVQDTRPKGKGS